MLHCSLQWQGWVSPRELAKQRRGVIPRRVMARLCRVRALNACTPRAGAGVLVRDPRGRRSPLEGGVSPRARRSPLEGGVSPRARRNLLEGGVSPRAMRNLLEGAFDWATPVGRGGHRSVGRALCACLGKRCILFLFFAGFKQDSPGFFRGPSGLSPTVAPEHLRVCRPGSHRC
jgi:hypothetical protein